MRFNLKQGMYYIILHNHFQCLKNRKKISILCAHYIGFQEISWIFYDQSLQKIEMLFKYSLNIVSSNHRSNEIPI